MRQTADGWQSFPSAYGDMKLHDTRQEALERLSRSRAAKNAIRESRGQEPIEPMSINHIASIAHENRMRASKVPTSTGNRAVDRALAEHAKQPKGERYDHRDDNFIEVAHDGTGKEIRVGDKIMLRNRNDEPVTVIGLTKDKNMLALGGHVPAVVHYRTRQGSRGATTSGSVKKHLPGKA